MCRKPEIPELNPEERDARTVVCMQLASRIRSDDLEEFFSSVGKVTSLVVQLINQSKYKYISASQIWDTLPEDVTFASTLQLFQ